MSVRPWVCKPAYSLLHWVYWRLYTCITGIILHPYSSSIHHHHSCSLLIKCKCIPGALTSVTNFATSVSRNMERLSLDSEHRERQEEWRRKKPAGLGDGFKQGMTGFGLSLLGMLVIFIDYLFHIARNFRVCFEWFKSLYTGQTLSSCNKEPLLTVWYGNSGKYYGKSRYQTHNLLKLFVLSTYLGNG